MLLLKLNIYEKAVLTLPDGREITVKITDVRTESGRKHAVVGVEAPRDVRVMREELTRGGARP